MSGLRVLVFGGDGQLGRELSDIARRQALALVSRGRDLDISDARKVQAALEAVEPDVVVNAAAYTKVDKAEADREAAWQANCVGAQNVALACAATGKPLLRISTDYVFDGTKASAYSESDQVAPLGYYGVSKEAGEQAIRNAWDRHLIIRTAWVYGRHGSNFLKTMVRLARERDALSVVADQVGNPTATEDLAEAVLAAARMAVNAACPWGTYHFAGSGDASWHSFAVAIIEAQARYTGRRPGIAAISTSQYPTPARRPANSRLDSRLFGSVFGFSAAPWRSRVGPIVEGVLHETGVPP